MSLIAQFGVSGGIGHHAILGIVVVAIILIVIAVLRGMEVNVPPFVVRILWIAAAAVLGILAILFILRFAGMA